MAEKQGSKGSKVSSNETALVKAGAPQRKPGLAARLAGDAAKRVASLAETARDSEILAPLREVAEDRIQRQCGHAQEHGQGDRHPGQQAPREGIRGWRGDLAQPASRASAKR